MLDTMLSQVPQSQVPPRTAQPPARAPAQAKENDSGHDFKGVLKSRMTTDSKADTGAEAKSEATSADTLDKPSEAATRLAEPAQSGSEIPPVDGKPLPLAEQSAEVLLTVLTGNVQGEQAPPIAPGDVAELERMAGEIVRAAPAAEALPEPPAGQTIEVLSGQAGFPIHTRPQPIAKANAVRNDAPTMAPTAIGHAVRELLGAVGADAESMDATQLGQASAGMRPPAAMPLMQPGLEALAARATTTDVALPMSAPPGAGAQGIQIVTPQDTAVATRSELPTATLNIPVRQPGWDQALGERVLWVVNQKFQGVELKLNPAHLGPIEVRVQMQNDQAQVSFVTQHGPVRDALEAALPRLREMFAANGFNLVDVNVSQHSFAEQQRHARSAGGGAGQGGFDAESNLDQGDDLAQADRGRSGRLPQGGVDLFA